MSLIEPAWVQEIIGGIANTGYWGMSVEGGKEYFFSAFAALPKTSGIQGTSKTGVSTPAVFLRGPLGHISTI